MQSHLVDREALSSIKDSGLANPPRNDAVDDETIGKHHSRLG